MNHAIVGKTQHGEISLDKLAEIQPGMARIMDEVAKRYYYLFYAAKEGNWHLAEHELNEVSAAMRIAKTTRPKYAEDLTQFEEEYLKPIEEAIREKNWTKFEQVYKRGMEGSDRYHDKYGYSYIRFILPHEPPAHLWVKRPQDLKR